MSLVPGDLVVIIRAEQDEKRLSPAPLRKPHLLVSLPSPNSALGICKIIPFGSDEPMPVYLKYLKKWEDQ